MMAPPIRLVSREGVIRRNWRPILVSFIGWSLIAAIPVTSAYVGAGLPGLGVWWDIFKKIGLYYYLWGLSAPLLYRLTDYLPYRGIGLFVTAPVHLLTLAMLSFCLGFIVHPEAWHEWLLGARAAGFHAMSFFTYSLIVLCSLAIKFYRLSLLRQREASDARIHAAQLDNKLNLARVDSLRMQMNPHFLFNALNSIASLVDSDQRDRAYQALEQLGDVLRLSLNLSKEDDISLGQEIRFCKAYLAMEKIRFGERLHVEWRVKESTMELHVPAFVLQPSVENAIKHAVSLSSEPVTVSVEVFVDDGELVLSVSDDGRADTRSGSIGGLGIANLRERLRLRFGGRVSVETGALARGYQTSVRIPVNLLATAPSE